MKSSIALSNPYQDVAQWQSTALKTKLCVNSFHSLWVANDTVTSKTGAPGQWFDSTLPHQKRKISLDYKISMSGV